MSSIAAAAPAQSVTKVVDTTADHPARKYIQWILAHHEMKGCTDFILRPRSEGPCFLRAQGRLQVARSLDCVTDKDGFLNEAQFEFDTAAKSFNPDQKDAMTFVFRMKSFQVRAQVSCGFNNRDSADYDGRQLANKRIFLRVQPRTPPRLSNTLERLPSTIPFLRDARGLVVVCGPIGSGKTTLAASIVKDMAETGKHIMSIEDPVEYWLEPKEGLVSHFDARFIATETDDRPSVQELIPHALRADLDGLFLGEIRDPFSLSTALNFAGAHEPVITTFHAGSIPDAITRMVTMASSVMSEKVAKMTLAQCLHSIIFTNLSFNAKGQAIPTMLCLPIQSPAVRKMIAECDPTNLHTLIESALANPSQAGRGAITRAQALEEAKTLGASAESLAAALPPQHTF